MLLDAADGVKFQYLKRGGVWGELDQPTFNGPLHKYRRKPAKIRHEKVLCGYLMEDGQIGWAIWSDDEVADRQKKHCWGKEIKREVVFVEIEE